MLVLGIETSCDDTSLGLVRDKKILAHLTYTEKSLEKWGGIVPEIASRNHAEKLHPLMQQLLVDANVSIDQIDLIGVTALPGLLGPLLTGIHFSKDLALFTQKPIVPVNHLYAHLEAIHLSENISYPYLGLLVSGGHGIYFLVKSAEDFTILGKTLDDAPGEAFDKGGRMMNLGYPAGRIIDELAAKGDAKKFPFPIGLKNSKDAHLSFSGVKTSLRYFLEKNLHFKDVESHTTQDFFDLCASYQAAIVGALVLKLKYAYLMSGHKAKDLPLVVGGGVACNSYLRNEIRKKYPNSHFVKPEFCTDNGAMIAHYASRVPHLKIDYPQCLTIDARSRFIDKKQSYHAK